MMPELLQATFILFFIGVSAAQRLVSENQHSGIRAGSEDASRQFNGGSLGETVNNLTKDYIRGVVNPTPEEVILQKSVPLPLFYFNLQALRGLFYQFATDYIFRRLFGMSAMDLALSLYRAYFNFVSQSFGASV